jgi:hypothetical protein
MSRAPSGWTQQPEGRAKRLMSVIQSSVQRRIEGESLTISSGCFILPLYLQGISQLQRCS